MPSRKLLPTVLLLLTCTAALPIPASAQEGSVTIGELRKRYEEASKSFTPEQAARIEELNQKRLKAIDAEIGPLFNESQLKACDKIEPGFAEKYASAQASYAYHMKMVAGERRRALGADISKLDFVDPDVVSGSFQWSDALDRQLTTGLAGVFEATGVKPELCTKLAEELRPYAGQEIGDQAPAQIEFSALREAGSGRIERCQLSWSQHDPAGMAYTGTAGIDLMAGSGDAPAFSFSMKVTDPKTLRSEDIEYGFVDFGSFNSRDHAQRAPASQIFMGYLPAQMFVDALAGMQSGKPLSYTVRVRDAAAERSFPMVVSGEALAKAADCAVSLVPSLEPKLVEAGFSPEPDKAHLEARALPPARYKTWQMPDGVSNPRMCVWLMDPREDVQFAAQMLTAGFLRPGEPMNHSVQFWVLGFDDPVRRTARANIEEAWLEIVHPNSGEAFDTRQFEKSRQPGERYIFALERKAIDPVFLGINKTGFTLHVRAKGAARPFSAHFEPPAGNEVEGYRQCVKRLARE